jgi:hypothetical protein
VVTRAPASEPVSKKSLPMSAHSSRIAVPSMVRLADR